MKVEKSSLFLYMEKRKGKKKQQQIFGLAMNQLLNYISKLPLDLKFKKKNFSRQQRQPIEKLVYTKKKGSWHMFTLKFTFKVYQKNFVISYVIINSIYEILYFRATFCQI